MASSTTYFLKILRQAIQEADIERRLRACASDGHHRPVLKLR